MKNTFLLATALLLAFAGGARAQILLYQDFDGPAEAQTYLVGTSPSPDQLSTAGTSPATPPATWSASGNAFTAGTYGEVAGNSNTIGATASLPFVPVDGNIYTLTANIAVTQGSGSGFAALGFTSSSASASSNFYALAPGPFLQLDSYNGMQTVSGVTNSFAASPNPGGNYTGTQYSIVLDTEGTDWTVAFYQGLTQLGTTYTYTNTPGNPATDNPVINDIAIGTDTYDAGVYSNLTLTDLAPAAPEPSTCMLLGLGGLALFMVRRLRALRKA
jgi:hypothetical protein